MSKKIGRAERFVYGPYYLWEVFEPEIQEIKGSRFVIFPGWYVGRMDNERFRRGPYTSKSTAAKIARKRWKLWMTREAQRKYDAAKSTGTYQKTNEVSGPDDGTRTAGSLP